MTAAEHPTNPMLEAALDAHDNGLCVIRAHTDGSKRPLGEWKRYQSERPTREQVAAWFADGHAGMGAISGAISGDLEMFELEGRLVANDGTKRFLQAMRDAGHELLLRRLINGFYTVSPSGGRHFLYRCTGAIDGNTKLAMNANNEVLIETRGEGGFVVLPPSHGTTHPTGMAWERKGGSFTAIPTITIDERDALFAVARTFDQAPAQHRTPLTPTGTPIAVVRATQRPVGASWMDATVEHLRHTMPLQQLLEHYGWTYSHTDRHGRHLMTRPGKDDGVSGSINTNGRLKVFSTSTPFDTSRTTYDQLDVIAAYEHRGNRIAAGLAVADAAGIRTPTTPAPPITPPPGVNPETGEIDDTDDTFWESRDYLSTIRQAARARLVAPSAVLGAVLARVAAWTPPSTCIPAIIGDESPLSLYIAIYGRSGSGKSTPAGTASKLLPGPPPGCIGPLQLGTGEGLAESYLELVEETDDDGKKRKVKRQIKRGALFNLDEGGLLAEIGARKGATIMPVLRTAWSGGDPGQANASAETRRHLTPGTYAVGLISAWQSKAATFLLGDNDGGTPQRFVWFTAEDPHATRGHQWPGALHWKPPPSISQPNPLGIDQQIVDEVADARVAILRGELTVDAMDTHRTLNKLKLAGCLAVLDHRHHITIDDWALAEEIMRRSDSIRDWIVAEHKRAEQATLEGRARSRAASELLVADLTSDKALERATKAVWRAVTRAHEEGRKANRRDIHHAIKSTDRKLVGTADAVDNALTKQWITGDDDSGYSPGSARPA